MLPIHGGLLKQLYYYEGEYECHITVNMDNEDQLDYFKAACHSLNATVIIIQLSQGKTPRQPMLSRLYKGRPEVVFNEISHLVQVLEKDFDVVRLKVEAGIFNQNIPQNDELAQSLSSSCYFEHHIKMQLPKTINLSQLARSLATYNGYLSKNALSLVGNDESQEYRFVTQRFRLGCDNARQNLDTLLAYLTNKKITVVKVIREFNIFDSNLDLDDGWATDHE